MSAMLHGCLADTDYLEASAKSGHTYGVWVTTPPGYADGSDPLPLIYVMDGNFAVGQTAPLIVSQADPFLSLFVRQPLPALNFLPGKMEALVDVRNLLAQGYVPVMAQDGRTLYLVQAAQLLRAREALTFGT